MLKVGLIGVGGISAAHIPAWDAMENAELVAICDIRPEQMEKYRETKRCYTDFEDMLKNEELDIVDVCLPTYLHTEYSVRALERGINVICEKPIALTREDVAKIYGAAERNNVKFMVAQVLRFWYEYEVIKKLYDEKTYGDLLSGTMTRVQKMPGWTWDNWMKDEKRSGLTPFDLHIHDLDFLVYAFGKPKAFKKYRSKRPEQDYLNCVYEFETGFVTAEAAWFAGAIPFTARFRFQFERAVAVYENGVFTIHDNEGNHITPSEAEGSAAGALGVPTTDAYANEIRYFAACVENNKPVEKVKPDELECVIDLLNA